MAGSPIVPWELPGSNWRILGLDKMGIYCLTLYQVTSGLWGLYSTDKAVCV